MPPLPWGTPEQIEFLSAKVPEFQAAQRTKTTPDFWTKIYQEFFVLWPTPDAEVRPMNVPKKKKKKKNAPAVDLSQTKPELSHAEWVKLRKNQIVNWFNNRGAGTQHRRGPVIVIGGNNTPRLLSETNLYSKKYYEERIRPRVVQALSANPDGHRIAIINKCTVEAWNDESEEVKAKIRAELAKLKELKGQIPEAPDVISPEECAINLLTLPETIQAFIDEMHSRTGWVFTVIAGGPEPADQGKIRTVAVHNGRDKYEQLFSVANDQFYQHVLSPYRLWLYNVFSQEDRDRQTINGSKVMQSGNQLASGSKIDGGADVKNPLSENPSATTKPDTHSNGDPSDDQVVKPAPIPTNPSTLVTQNYGTHVPASVSALFVNHHADSATQPAIATPTLAVGASVISGVTQALTGAQNNAQPGQVTTPTSAQVVGASAVGTEHSSFQPTQNVAVPNPPYHTAANTATQTPVEAQSMLPPSHNPNHLAPVASFLPYGGNISVMDHSQDMNQVTTIHQNLDRSLASAIGQDMMLMQSEDINGGNGQSFNFSDEEWNRIDLALQQYAANPNMTGTPLALNPLQNQNMTGGLMNAPMTWNPNHLISAPHIAASTPMPVPALGIPCPNQLIGSQMNAPVPSEPNHPTSAPHIETSVQTPAPAPSVTNTAGILSDRVNGPTIPASEHAPVISTPNESENIDVTMTRTRSRKAAALKDPPQPVAWLLAASEYLFKDIDVEKWQDCVRAWESFERTEIAEMDTSSLRLPAKGRPTALGKWLSSSRKYTTIPAIRQNEFRQSWINWWNTIQPAWRQNKAPNSLPLSFEIAKGKDSMAALRKGGPNGLLTVMIGLKWWYSAQDSDGLWELAVTDVLNTFNSFQTATSNKRKATEETGKGKRTKKAKV